MPLQWTFRSYVDVDGRDVVENSMKMRRHKPEAHFVRSFAFSVACPGRSGVGPCSIPLPVTAKDYGKLNSKPAAFRGGR